jgi:replicative DNA helicase
VLRDNSVLHELLQTISVDQFYFDGHRKIFQAMIDLSDNGQPIDLVLLAEALKQRKELEDCGGYEYLAELWTSAPTAANAEYYSRIVREKSITRNLIHASTEILRDSYEQAQPADELLGQAESKILKIAESGSVGKTYTLSDVLKEAYDRIDARKPINPSNFKLTFFIVN